MTPPRCLSKRIYSKHDRRARRALDVEIYAQIRESDWTMREIRTRRIT
jgi:hypothetical protein